MLRDMTQPNRERVAKPHRSILFSNGGKEPDFGLGIAIFFAGVPDPMAYVITDTCTKDNHCIDSCPVNCIHPTPDEPGYAEAEQLYVNPAECIDCGACIPVCPTTSIYVLEELPEELAAFAEKNAAYYA
jgi:NAD-dependent dihydropyrimidine dehydrogenase PreA subunit